MKALLRSPKLIAALLCMMVFSVYAGTLFFQYAKTQSIAFNMLRERIKSLAISASLMVDGDLHKKVIEVNRPQGPEYRDAVAPLIKFHNALPAIFYVYTMVERGGVAYFVLDTAGQPELRVPHNLRASRLLEEFEDSGDQTWLELLASGQAYVNAEFETDAYGTFLSGHAPIFASDGSVAGFSGVDMDLRFYLAWRKGFERTFLLDLAIAAILSLFIGWIALMLLEKIRDHAKELERKRVDAERLKAFSQVTGGVAHEFNNLLQAVIGGLTLLKKEIGNSKTAAQIIGIAERAVLKGSDLTYRLLSYVGRYPIRPTRVDVGSVVEDITKLLGPMLNGKTEIDLKVDDGLWPVVADRNQLESALLHIALNARDAIPDRGRIVIEAANVSRHEACAARNREQLKPGEYVKLSVADNGTGMSPEVKAQAFEPFFTTKDVDQGTGLGLSMAYGFVTKQSCGFMDIDSKEGTGTTVTIYLPRAPNGPDAALKTSEIESFSCPRVTERRHETDATVPEVGAHPTPAAH